MALDSMRDLLLKELRDIHSAEGQIEKSLPKAIEKVDSEELREALSEHLEETREHVRRLDQIATLLGERLSGEHCPAMEGLLKEVKERLDLGEKGAVRDAAIISSLQRVEHYEIAAYGSARTFAELEEEDEVEELLAETLDEEKNADERLTDIALSSVNEDAEMIEEAEFEDEEREADEAAGGGTKSKSRRSSAQKKAGGKGKRSEGGRIGAS